jgi:hypothetical protein
VVDQAMSLRGEAAVPEVPIDLTQTSRSVLDDDGFLEVRGSLVPAQGSLVPAQGSLLRYFNCGRNSENTTPLMESQPSSTHQRANRREVSL